MKFIVPYSETFDIRCTLDCGQVFRYTERDGIFTLKAGAEICEIRSEKEGYEFCTDNPNFFVKYFDLDRNYGIIQKIVQDKGLVSSAIEFGQGIHILNQEPLEVIFSFIISANNNIPRIKSIIERLCEALGERKNGYFAFPTLDALARADAKLFFDLGAGYRADYIAKTAAMLLDEDVEGFKNLPTDVLRKKLMSFAGVGRKVADCILLFAYHRTDVFPVDTWIRKVFRDEFGDIAAEKLSEKLVKRYGENSGYVQQWLFYQKRSLDTAKELRR